MRPARFEQLLLAAAQSLPGVTRAATFADAGYDRSPYGVQVDVGGKVSRWQVNATSVDGERYEQPEAEPALGAKPAMPVAPPQAVGSPAQVEAALVAAVLGADPGEIASVDLYSLREKPPEVGHGATLGFHDKSKIFINYVR